jgi:phosphopantothenoylcysteine decarboxylase/phosphopantothenate--cysteine ligase
MTLAWPIEKPFHIFPAMNTQMLRAAPTQTNLELLRSRGFKVAPTEPGNLACGENGEGRLLEPERILQFLNPQPPKKLGRVLITAGATREPIDGIRFISNVSTGQTGAELATELSQRGWQVTYLAGQGAQRPARVSHALGFNDFADLERKLKTELDQRDYSAVIHCAAVSDFSLENAERHLKLSSGEPLQLDLKPNPKLLPRLKQFSRHKNLRVVGFKLTLNSEDQHTRSRARDLLGPNVDAVVANDWSQVDGDRSRHPGHLLTTSGESRFETVTQLANLLHQFLLQSAPQEKSHDLSP